jgi:putative hemolysin
MSLNLGFIIIAALLKPFTFGVLMALIVMAFLLFCSAIFSASEIAFFSLSAADINAIKSGKTKKGKAVVRLLEAPKRLLATILIGNNFVNIGIVVLSTYIVSVLFNFTDFPTLGFVIQVVLVTFLILLLGEIMPKIYTSHYPIKFALFIANPMKIIVTLFHPVSSLLMASTSIIDKRIRKKSHNISIDDLSQALEITQSDNATGEDRKILKGIVNFGDIDVKEIMGSRMDIVAVDFETNFEDLMKIILDAGYSRMPVFKEDLDHISGVLYIKDIIPHIGENSDFKWQEKIRTPFFVPESKKINDLLQDFREKKIHMAVVIDEYGGTSGLVTLEDIIEEIVGEINDEFDSENNDYVKVDENTYVFEGKILLNDFYKITGVENDFFDDVKGESDTLAGLMLELEGKIPEKNHRIYYRNFVFRMESVDKRRIKRIKVVIKKNQNEEH